MSLPKPNFDTILALKEHAASVEDAMRVHLDARPAIPTRLRKAIDHSLFAGGKRLRPALVIEWFHAARQSVAGRVQNSKSSSDASAFDLAMRAACAIELIHTFSLVHDDLPAMDDDDLRRGRPTCHRAFDEATAILAGDAMMSLAFEILAEQVDDASHHPSPRPADSSRSAIASLLITELARATGPLGMIGGQMLDIGSEGISLPLTQLQQLHSMKTGALLIAACRMGTLAAASLHPQGPDLLRAATAFGSHVGLAFQITDDILDVTSTPEQLGKATNKDSEAGKNTYPKLLGLDASQQLARQELHDALNALDPLGPYADRLAAIAHIIADRSS